MSEQQVYSCQVVCYADTFEFAALTDVLLSAGRGAAYRGVFYLQVEEGSCAVFPFGVAVYWNLRQDVIDRLATDMRLYSMSALAAEEVDYFSYMTRCERNRFFHDYIELVDAEPMTLLAISHPLAQSNKLAVFERQAQKTIESTSVISQRLAETGSTSLSRRQTAKMRGQLFLTKSDIILKYELLDTPEFFWEHPELQSIYDVGASYLELKPRTDILSLKLETIHEMLEMLADDLKHQHSSKLEWIIIWLIAVEIVIFFFNDVLLPH